VTWLSWGADAVMWVVLGLSVASGVQIFLRRNRA
jgi:hypothetical protein